MTACIVPGSPATWVAIWRHGRIHSGRAPAPACPELQAVSETSMGQAMQRSAGDRYAFKLVCPGVEPRDGTGKREKIMLWQALQHRVCCRGSALARKGTGMHSVSLPTATRATPACVLGGEDDTNRSSTQGGRSCWDVHTSWLLMPSLLNHTKHPLLRDPKADTAPMIYMLSAHDVYNAHYQGCSRG